MRSLCNHDDLARFYYRALEHQEAVLLVGETGVGKTTLCQTLAFVRGQRLRIINCNLHTEAADMLGGYRPARDRNRAFAAFCAAYAQLEQYVDLHRMPGITSHSSTLCGVCGCGCKLT